MAQEAAAADRYLPMSFVQLKQECQKRGLDPSGTKDHLLKRLVSNDLGMTPKRSPSSPSLSEISQLEKAERPDPKSARTAALSPRARAAEIDAQLSKSSRVSPEVSASRRRSADRMSRSKTTSAIGPRDEQDKDKERSQSRKDKEREKERSHNSRTPPMSPKPGKSAVIEPRRTRESDTEEKDRERSSGDKEKDREHRDRERDRVVSPQKERSTKASPKERDSKDKEERDKEKKESHRDKKEAEREKKDKDPDREKRDAERKEKKLLRESPRGPTIERPGSPGLNSNPAYSPPPASASTILSRPGVTFVSPRATVGPIASVVNYSSGSSSNMLKPPAATPETKMPPTAEVKPTELKPAELKPPEIQVDSSALAASVHVLAKGSLSTPASAARVTSSPPASAGVSPRPTKYLVSEVVYLSCQNVKDEDAFKIAEEISSESKTRELLLGGNAISSHGGVAIAKALEKNTTLKRLVLGDNPMGDVAGTALANALRVNTTLQELGLSNTALSNATARAFQASRPLSLQRLVLQGNGMISAEGGRAMLDVAIASPNLQELDMRHTEVLPEIIDEITKVLRQRKAPLMISKTAPSTPTGPGTPPGDRKNVESPRQPRASKAKKYPARTVTAVIEEGVLSAMPLLIEISPVAITLHYAPAPPRMTFVRTIPLSEAKNFYGKGSDLRFTWRLKSGNLMEEVFECEKATKIVKRLLKWTQRRAEEEAKQKKKEAELLSSTDGSSSPAKGDSGKNLLTAKDPSKEKSLIRAFSQSKLSQLVSSSDKQAPPGGRSQGHGSMRPGTRKEKEIVITRPTSMIHKTHVDRELQWTGEAEFQLAEKIGGGAFATVYRAVHESGVVLAIKVVTMGRAQNDQLRTEVDLLKRCRDYNIVRLYGTIQKDDSLWILMDYCAAGSVLDLMKTLKRTLQEEEIAVVLLSVLKGLTYLHREGIIHRDLKSANILLSDSMEPKIADFGVSAQIGNMLSKRNSIVGTPLFMSPETLDGAKPDAKSDIWSVGIMAIELAEGEPPYAAEHVLRAMKLLCTEPPPRLKDQSKWSETFHSFIASCLRTDPTERPSAPELLSHPFIMQCISSGAKDTVPVRLATEFGLVKRATEGPHTHQNLKFSVIMEEKDRDASPAPGTAAAKGRPRSTSGDRGNDKHKDEIEVRGTSNELPWETIDEQPRSGEALARQLSGGKMASPRDSVVQPALHISSPFGIVSVGELREKLVASERRNQELELQLAESKKQLANMEKQLAAEKQWNADLGQLLGGVLELRVAADKLERDFKGFLAKRGT